MAKDAFWFRHDSNARNDSKMVKLRRLAGLEGYGLFWAVVEMLRETESYELECDTIDDICFDLRCDRGAFDELFNCGLLSTDETVFWSASLKIRMSEWDEKSRKRKEAGRKGGKAKAMLKQTSSNATKKASNALPRREEKRREEESIVDLSCAESLTSPAQEVIYQALMDKFERISTLKNATIIKLVDNLASDAFPGVDVPAEIKRAAMWEDNNPSKKKTPRGLPRFLCGWMDRSQNKGGIQKPAPNTKPTPINTKDLYD